MDGSTLPQALILRPVSRAQTGRVLLMNTTFFETLSSNHLPLRRWLAPLCTSQSCCPLSLFLQPPRQQRLWVYGWHKCPERGELWLWRGLGVVERHPNRTPTPILLTLLGQGLEIIPGTRCTWLQKSTRRFRRDSQGLMCSYFLQVWCSLFIHLLSFLKGKA